MMALGLSSCICYLGTQLATLWSMPSQSITIITGITVAAATIMPKYLAPLAPSAEGLALLMMQVGRGAVCVRVCVCGGGWVRCRAGGKGPLAGCPSAVLLQLVHTWHLLLLLLLLLLGLFLTPGSALKRGCKAVPLCLALNAARLPACSLYPCAGIFCRCGCKCQRPVGPAYRPSVVLLQLHRTCWAPATAAAAGAAGWVQPPRPAACIQCQYWRWVWQLQYMSCTVTALLHAYRCTFCSSSLCIQLPTGTVPCSGPPG
jgi:hypothetical protein